MGTGIVAVLLISIPFKAQWLYYLSIVFFVLNTVLFALALATSILRYSLYPEIWTVMIQDPVNSLFIATMPMGLATLIEMWVFVCVPLWGPWARTFAWALWMVDSVIAVAVTVFLSFFLSVPIHSDRDDDSQADDVEQCLSRSYQVVGQDHRRAAPTHCRHYCCGWNGLGSCRGFTEQRTCAGDTDRLLCPLGHGNAACNGGVGRLLSAPGGSQDTAPRSDSQQLSPTGSAWVWWLWVWLPINIITSSVVEQAQLTESSIMYLGKVSRDIFQETNALDPMAGSILYVLGFFVAIIMWGFGLVWFCLALASIYQSRPFPFNMGWWGFTFPLGVFAASTIQLGIELSSLFFRVLGTVSPTPPAMLIDAAISSLIGSLDLCHPGHLPMGICRLPNGQGRLVREIILRSLRGEP
jgi:tellurite resistance protein TehA-like permease